MDQLCLYNLFSHQVKTVQKHSCILSKTLPFYKLSTLLLYWVAGIQLILIEHGHLLEDFFPDKRELSLHQIEAQKSITISITILE